jgi:hypothetical protein
MHIMAHVGLLHMKIVAYVLISVHQKPELPELLCCDLQCAWNPMCICDQCVAIDVLVWCSMKRAAKCGMHCDLYDSVNQSICEHIPWCLGAPGTRVFQCWYYLNTYVMRTLHYVGQCDADSCKFVLAHMYIGMQIHKSSQWQVCGWHKTTAHDATCCPNRVACAIGLTSAITVLWMFMKPYLHTRQI